MSPRYEGLGTTAAAESFSATLAQCFEIYNSVSENNNCTVLH